MYGRRRSNRHRLTGVIVILPVACLLGQLRFGATLASAATATDGRWSVGRSHLWIRGGSSSDDPYSVGNELPALEQESFQDRIDAWKKYQQEQYSTVNAANVPESGRDAEGRMKLLTSVSKGSRALIFFLLLWRDVHLYEVADTTLTGVVRLLVVTPLCALFLANLAGVVASLTSPGHSAKKRLKAILNLDKLVEAILIAYNFIRLTVWPAKYAPREVFIANTLHSVFFLLQSQAFTRVTWDQITEQSAFTDRPSYGGGSTTTTTGARSSSGTGANDEYDPYDATTGYDYHQPDYPTGSQGGSTTNTYQ